MTLRSPGTQERAREAGPYRSVAKTGLYTGLLLTFVMFVALVAANRVPVLERYAIVRNAISGGLFFILALVPVLRRLGGARGAGRAHPDACQAPARQRACPVTR